MPAMKCPSAQCAFLFDPAKVPPGAVLVCPRCAMRFTVGPPTPAAPPAGYGVPAGYPATASFNPGDVPGLPADGQATLGPGGYGVATPGPVTRPTPPDARPPAARPQSSGFASTLLTVLGVLALLSVVVGAVVFVAVSKRGGGVPAAGPADSEVRVPERNFAYTLPGAGWRRDTDAQNELGANVFALQREGTPAGWVALTVIDYETRDPPAGELHEETQRQLSRAFEDVPSLTPEPAKWGPHAARKCFFRAVHRATQVPCVGDAYAMSHKGVGYWFYAWAAEADAAALAGDFDAMRERLRTLDQRTKWVAAATPDATFRSVKPSSRFRLTSSETIWAAPPVEPTVEDPAAELLLKGVVKSRVRRDFNPEALAVVMVVPGTAEPAAVAEEYVRKRHTRDPAVFGPTAITEVTGDVTGDGPPDKPGAVPARRLKVSPGDPDASKVAEKLVVFAAMKSGDAVVIAESNCPWSQRDVWERRLVQLVGSLRP